MTIQIYQPSDYPGISQSVASFRTWDTLESYLTVQPAGSVAILLGAAAVPVLVAMSDGAGAVQVISDVDFTQCDGSEFTIGLTGAFNIQGADGVAPTLSAAGLDLSLIEGEVYLHFHQLGGVAHVTQALLDCAIPNIADGQVVAVGSSDSYCGVSYVLASPGWHRLTWVGAPPVLSAGTGVVNQVLKPAGAQFVFCDIAQSVSSTNRYASLGGSFDSTDPAAATLQSSIGSLFGFDGTLSFPTQLYCEGKAQVDFSVVLQRLFARGGLI